MNYHRTPLKAIILAGGLGTRLRSVVKDVPKPMADINGRPFLSYLLDYIIKQDTGIKEVVLSVGYKYEQISGYFGNEYKSLNISYAVEETPLGTGGAIKNAFMVASGKEKEGERKNSGDIVVFNGDTFFYLDLRGLIDFHREKKSDFTIALKEMANSDRYGFIEIDKDNKIRRFNEKNEKGSSGYINGGIYIFKADFFDGLDLPHIFSFEKDFLEKYMGNSNGEFKATGNIGRKAIYGLPCKGFFIDIGVPEDYERAKLSLII